MVKGRACRLAVLGSTLGAAVLSTRRSQKSVKGDVVFITGAGSGLGRRLSILFSSLGAKVALADIDLKAAESTQKMLKSSDSIAVFCDVASPQSIKEAVDTARQRLGAITILVNNAGIVNGKTVLDTSVEAVERTFRVNAMAHIYTVKEVLPEMIKMGKGHIVNVASAAGIVGAKGLVDYCGSKFAAVGIDESLRMELQSSHPRIKTTCIIPYFINTGMFSGVTLRHQWFLPLLDEAKTAAKIIQGVREEREVIVLPWTLNLAYWVRAVMPVKGFDAVAKFLGLSHIMDTYRGRPRL